MWKGVKGQNKVKMHWLAFSVPLHRLGWTSTTFNSKEMQSKFRHSSCQREREREREREGEKGRERERG